MIASDLITQIYYAYRGKGASKVPVWGSEKANTALAIANRKKNEWARDNKYWSSLFNYTTPNELGTVATAGTTTLTGIGTYFTDYKVNDTILVDGETSRIIQSITSNTVLDVTIAFANTASGKSFTHTSIIEALIQQYKLHRNFYIPSDSARVVTTTQTYELGTSKVQSRANEVFFYGINPKKIAFATTPETQYVGGSLIVPGYYIPSDLILATDEVSVDDPNWLVYTTAAELARNDPAKEDQFSSLIGMANDLHANMVKANMDIGFQQGNTVTYNMPSMIPSLDDWSM